MDSTTEMNRKTAHELANSVALSHKEAYECHEERIFNALQVAQKRGEVLERRRHEK